MYDKIKQAMLAAFRRDNPECEDNVDIILEEDKKRIEMNVNKTVVDEVEDPSHEINLRRRKKISRRAKLGDVLPIPWDEEVRPHRGAGCKAGHHSGHPRGGARHNL